MVTRKMGSSVSPVVELTEKDGLYTLKTTSPFKNTEIKFKLGEEFEEETADGRKVKTVCTLDGNNLVQVQKGGDKDTTIEREFGPTEMKAVSAFFRRSLGLMVQLSINNLFLVEHLHASLTIMIKIKYLHGIRKCNL